MGVVNKERERLVKSSTATASVAVENKKAPVNCSIFLDNFTVIVFKNLFFRETSFESEFM